MKAMKLWNNENYETTKLWNQETMKQWNNETMKLWNYENYEPMKSWNYETTKLRNYETMELWTVKQLFFDVLSKMAKFRRIVAEKSRDSGRRSRDRRPSLKQLFSTFQANRKFFEKSRWTVTRQSS